MELFIGGAGVLIYLGLAFACMIWALSWAKKKRFGIKGRAVVVLAVLFITYAVPLASAGDPPALPGRQ